jgi:hypothetical protein
LLSFLCISCVFLILRSRLSSTNLIVVEDTIALRLFL